MIKKKIHNRIKQLALLFQTKYLFHKSHNQKHIKNKKMCQMLETKRTTFNITKQQKKKKINIPDNISYCNPILSILPLNTHIVSSNSHDSIAFLTILLLLSITSSGVELCVAACVLVCGPFEPLLYHAKTKNKKKYIPDDISYSNSYSLNKTPTTYPKS